MDDLLEERVRVILGELRSVLGARRASVVPRDGAHAEVAGHGGLRTLPLGHGARLEVELGPVLRPDEEVDLALEQAVRALRGAGRDLATELPAVSVLAGGPPRPTRIADRVHAYLHGLAALHGAQNALCTVHGEVVASAHPPEPLEVARAELLERRAHAAALSRGLGHGDLADPDAYVLTFWINAALILYFAGPYSVDFVRHRARAVARELSDLLPDLEPDPSAPAAAVRPEP